MDPLIVRGRFEAYEIESGGEVFRPTLSLEHDPAVEVNQSVFLVDSGADLSLICPSNAVGIWGLEDYQGFDFRDEDPSATHPISGVGGMVRGAWKELELRFPLSVSGSADVSGRRIGWISFGKLVVLVAPPEANFGISLLGWDIMERFERVEFKRRQGIFDLVLDTAILGALPRP